MENPSFLFSAAAFIAAIGLLVFIHEMGHYLAARAFGIRVEAFAVGFGREIVGFTDRRGTRWKIGWLPLGGYAKFVGDMNAASRPDPGALALPAAERAGLFQFAPLRHRAVVVAAGPVFNFLFAILLFAGFFMTWGQQYTPPVLAGVEAGTPAAAAGLRAGDRITAVDGRALDRFEDLARTVRLSDGSPIALTVARGGGELSVDVRPRILTGTDRFGGRYTMGMLGVRSGEPVVVRRGPARALIEGVRETGNVTRAIVEGLHQIVTGRRDLSELGGPVKIAQVSGQAASLGLVSFVMLLALLSVNLGFINLLPVPMLDGGHLLLYAVEAVRRRPLGARLTEWAFMSGAALMLTLMLVLTWNDLSQAGLWRRLAEIVG